MHFRRINDDPNINSHTLNLSKIQLNENDTRLLNKGLSYIPSVHRVPCLEVKTALDKLKRTLYLKDFFRDKDKKNFDPKKRPLFVGKSTWLPKINQISYQTLDLFCKIENETENFLKRKYKIQNDCYIIKDQKDNLDRNLRDCMAKLKNQDNIVIKAADKGGKACIIDKEAYIAEANRQLDNGKYYRKIDGPLKTTIIPKINKILNDLRFKGIISLNQHRYLTARETDSDRYFYMLPKIHKAADKWPRPDMPEGRPIVGDCGTESRRVSDYIDHFLQPLANKHASYLKDSYDFVDKIRDKIINKNYLLVTGDVTALYTNMNITRSLKCVKDIFENNPDRKRPDKEILDLLKLVLENNDFSFNDQTYLQIFGTAMGKSFAPNLANIYLLEFDDKAMNGHEIKPLLFFRFLDDIFFIWPGTTEELKIYETYLNNLIPDIKITLNHNTEEINFLDLIIYKSELNENESTLLTRVYFKPTDSHQLLDGNSFHPKHTCRGILKSQILRYKRLSSKKEDFDNTCQILFNSLKDRGYSKSLMRKMKREIWNNYNNIGDNNNRVNYHHNNPNFNGNPEPNLNTNANSNINGLNYHHNNPNFNGNPEPNLNPNANSNINGPNYHHNNHYFNGNPDPNPKFGKIPIVIKYSPLASEITTIWKNLLKDNRFFGQFKFITAYKRNLNLKTILAPSKMKT
jgi:hypothetical protein